MSYYVYGSKMSYTDYLTAKSFVSDVSSATRSSGREISMEISRRTREVIASNEAMARDNIRAIEANTDALNAGFDRLSYGLDNISSGISDLNATFHWGFSQLLSSMGRMNDSLSELINISKTPAQTAAYEQYEIARDAFRRGLYEECMESLTKAISGDSTSSGYKLEWRFYQMKGTVQLGFVGCETAMLDLAKAEESFLLSARYARTDFPEYAAKAYLSAGWAAYCQGKLPESLAHTEKAISIDPSLGEAFFQASKVLMAQDEVDTALPLLSKAIDRDSFFALKAGGDGDFQKHDARLCDFLETLRTKKYKTMLPKVKESIEHVSSWLKHTSSQEDSSIHQRMKSFLLSGEKWSLMDLYGLSNALNEMEFVQVQLPGKTITREENYQVEETYKEEVIIKPGGLFRKAVTEFQNFTRMVTKTRTVNENLDGKIVWIKKVKIDTTHSDIAAGQFYYGKVVKIVDFGAFVELFPKTEGLLHISQLDMKPIKRVSDVLSEGDRLLVKCMEVDKNGKIRLSRKEALEEFLYGGQVLKNDK